MKKLFRSFILMCLFGTLYSCTPSPPYEVTSPCVANDSDNPYALTPCTRIHLNLGRVIT
ncbi:MAG: DUF2706 domain-containing protein [Rickettsiaceae bacterium]